MNKFLKTAAMNSGMNRAFELHGPAMNLRGTFRLPRNTLRISQVDSQNFQQWFESGCIERGLRAGTKNCIGGGLCDLGPT